MKPSCARGSGKLPRYVEWIDWRPPGGVIRLAGEGLAAESSITCASDDELRARCREFATQRYLFSIGGRAGWGPADIMGKWQEDGHMPLSFLQVSWTGPGEWQVHEMMPGVQQWDIRPLGDMLDNQPLEWTGPAERSL